MLRATLATIESNRWIVGKWLLTGKVVRDLYHAIRAQPRTRSQLRAVIDDDPKLGRALKVLKDAGIVEFQRGVWAARLTSDEGGPDE